MKALIFLAILALAAQAQFSEVNEFYKAFISNIHMDSETKNEITNNGLQCLNHATNVLLSSFFTIQHNAANKDFITVAKNVLNSLQTLEESVLPECAYTYMQLAAYLGQNANLSHITTSQKAELFQAKLLQLVGTAVLNVARTSDSTQLAQELANVVNVAAGFVDAELPYVVEFEWEKYVPVDRYKAIPEFLKGFFTTLGFKNLTRVNATSQCVLDVIVNLETVISNPVLYRGDRFTAANSFLDSITLVTDAVERCKKLDTVNLTFLAVLASALEKHTAETLVTMAVNTIPQLSLLTQSKLNMNVYFLEGRYEVAGQLFATQLKTVFNGLLYPFLME